jgi:drug/metabolite transporter (DMT)-like permease
MTFISSFASFFLKKSTTGETILGIAKNKFLYIGGFLYIIAALLNVWILQKMPYSVVLPLGSICYIWTMFIAIIFLKEKIVKGKIIGLSLIITGVIFLAI